MNRSSFLLPKRRWLVPVALLCLGALLSWHWLGWQAIKVETRHKFPAVPRIQTKELAAWLDDPSRPPPVLIDVREAAEFDVSHLADARRAEPGSDPATLHLPRDQPVVTYCSVGYRSAAFGQRLRQAGYTRVQNLEGSLFQWANEGRPVVADDGRRSERVHPYNKIWGLLLKPSLRADVPVAGAPH